MTMGNDTNMIKEEEKKLENKYGDANTNCFNRETESRKTKCVHIP